MEGTMRMIASVKLIAVVITMLFFPSVSIPSQLIGKWRIGSPYSTPNPVGINAEQEKHIRSLQLIYSAHGLHVCGKDIPLRTATLRSLTSDQFLQAYGFLPHVIGMEESTVVDLTINLSDGMNACGNFEDPGVHVLIGSNNHFVIEVANDYLPLKKE
jgi:hypothetical protein